MLVQLVVASGNRKGQVIPVSIEKFIIGRAEDCHLKSKSELISRYHCAILVGNDAAIRDLGSKNGVRLNGKKIDTEQKLSNGDHLVIGPLEFYVHVVADANTAADIVADDQISWYRSGDSEIVGSGIESSAPTILLDKLKSIHQERAVEPESIETNPLKRIL